MINSQNWPFDQAENVTCITTRQVLENGLPVLSVLHYSDDDSWAFLCGTTDDPNDGRVIAMKQAVEMDESVLSVADLPPGWRAYRESVYSTWIREKDDSI